MAKIPNPPQFTPKSRNNGQLQLSNDDWYKLRTAIDDIIRAMGELNNDITTGVGSGSGGGYPPQLGHSRI